MTLDTRGLEPPEPMMQILEKLASVGEDDILEVKNDRRPMFLYPKLEERGFVHQTEERPDGSILITIQRKKES
ncbi:MAG: DUF2249 domain-containing protein [Firmicutes bacterium]|nr:DUF2249 domain-containing protein [Bacillota bacterium]